LTSQPQLLHPAAPPEPPATSRLSGRWWLLAVAAAVAVTLNVLADTVTLSRLIDTVGPVRWFDRLGRVPASDEPS